MLQCAYPFEKARLVAREMADQLALSLVEKGLVTDQLVLTVGYDVDNLTDPAIRKSYRGPVTTDRYGRAIPKHAHGTEQLERPTSSCRQLMEAVARLFDRVVDAGCWCGVCTWWPGGSFGKKRQTNIRSASSWISLPTTRRRKRPAVRRKPR